MAGGLFVVGGDAAELLELAEAAFDEVAFPAERLIEGVLAGAGRAVGDDRDGTCLADGLAEPVGVVGSVGQDNVRPVLAEQGEGPRRIAVLAR